MSRKFFVFLFTFILLGSVSAVSLTPSSLTLNSGTGEKICTDFEISDESYSGDIEVYDRWAPEGFVEKEVAGHNLLASDVGIAVDYSREVRLENGEATVRLCVTPQNSGTYHGLLVFRTQNAASNVALSVGAWVQLEVEGNSVAGSGSSGVRSLADEEVSNAEEKIEQLNFEDSKSGVSEQNSGTSLLEAESGTSWFYIVGGFVLGIVIAGLIGMVVYRRKRRHELWCY